VLHLLPHWNWPGQEGRNMDVRCFSNCEEVELFLNGQSLGRRPMPKNSHLQWQVAYAPGTLSAKGYTGGKLVQETKVETTGEPAAIQLTPDRATINADGEDVSVVTVAVNDGQGRLVPVAGNLVKFEINGPGKIIGVGNGDPSCHEPDISTNADWSRSVFNGLAQVLVQAGKDPGDLRLTARSEGLAETTLVLHTAGHPPRAALP